MFGTRIPLLFFIQEEIMIKHIVCFKLKDTSSAAKEAAAQRLLSMKGKVPVMKAIEVGTDFLGSARSYDIILQVTLETKADLEAYQRDEYHCSFVKPYMHANCVSSVAVDYEI